MEKNSGEQYQNQFLCHQHPTGATKVDIKKIFSPFGKLTDVYFGEKSGRNGKNFGFIRFVDVPDVKVLQEQLNRILCRNNKLEINVERHKRKDAPNNPIPVRKQFPTYSKVASNSIWNTSGGFRDGGSFAEVVRHKAGPTPVMQASTLPIQLIDDD